MIPEIRGDPVGTDTDDHASAPLVPSASSTSSSRGNMPKSRFAMYAPFLVLALVQAIFVAAFPSTGTDRAVGTTGFDSDQFAGGPAGSGGTDFGSSGSGVTGGVPGSTTAGGTGGTAGGTGGAAGGTAGGTGGQAGGAAGGPGGAAAAEGGDTSHCAGERQMNVFAVDFENPPCKPKWPEGADNGGETWTGVTADSIKVVIIEPAPNEQLDAILKSQGLASTPQDREAVRKAAAGFVNKYYETYGREVVFERFEARCPSTPADVPTCIADARKVIEMQPFAVFFAQPSYPELFEEFTRAGILTIGGWHFDKELFAGRRPFRWDIFVDGTDSAEFIAEYYCKKLQGKAASNAGTLIHPQIGGRNTPRRLGIVVPDRPANKSTADLVAARVKACGGNPVLDTYPNNIDRAQNEANRIVSGMVSEGVTTVVCMCDPIFPVFLTSSASAASYFPEHMLPGLGLLDADTVGRLYTREQWIHAFGPSHLADTRPFADEQVSRVFKDQGMGTPCNSCNLPWVYYSLFASMVHNAGPDLNPGTVEAGLFNLAKTRGQGVTIGLGFRPGDYSAIDDIREAYWVPTARSQVDGNTGSYRSIDSGKRYVLGEFTSEFKVPVEPTQG